MKITEAEQTRLLAHVTLTSSEQGVALVRIVEEIVTARELPSATIEAVAVAVQREHYKAAGSAYRGGWPGPRDGSWRCGCGVKGTVSEGDTATGLHREHVGRVLAVALTGGAT